MRTEESKRIWRVGEYNANCFRSLPERAQEVWFQYCEESIKRKDYYNLAYLNFFEFGYENCKSPIEVIFNFAYDLVSFSEGYVGFSLLPQYEVATKANKYFVDFAFFAEDVDGLVDVKNPNFKLAIECDGHEFHEKTKDQVERDNEREYDLKMNGFDVLRFSGSQIYKNPFRCAWQTLSFINNKIGESE